MSFLAKTRPVFSHWLHIHTIAFMYLIYTYVCIYMYKFTYVVYTYICTDIPIDNNKWKHMNIA